jgi:hypothetical protein
MEDTLQKLTTLLQSHFPNCELELEYREDGKITGFMTWEGFVDLDHIDRQRKVWGVIRQNLSGEDQTNVRAVLTLTPEEMSHARAG